MTTNPSSNTGTQAVEYVRHSFAVCAIPLGRKGPTARGWNSLENAITSPTAAATLTGNVGLLHAWSGTMALDVDDWGAASEWLLAHGVNLAQLFTASDRVEIASGRAGRAKLLFRLPASLNTPVQTLQVKGGDSGMTLEFRCADANGNSMQDVLPPSIHPDTGKPYQWGGSGDWRNLPVIPEVLLQVWQVELSIRAKGSAMAAPLTLLPGFAPQSFEPLPGFAPLKENLWGLTVVESALDHVSPDTDYPTWRNIGWAIMATGWTCAPQIVHGWSQHAHFRYDRDATETLIRSFDPAKGITLATLFHHAKQNGWNIPQQYPLAVIPSASPAPPPPIVPPPTTGVTSLPRQIPAAQAVDEINKHFGFAHDWGGKSTHFRFDGSGRAHPCSPQEVKEALASRSIVNADRTRKPAYAFWNSSQHRREVAQVFYDPTGCTFNASGEAVLNLWRGFGRTPRAGSCQLMIMHLLKVVCSGNTLHLHYLLAWMAHLVQRPWEAPGVVIVLRSQREGTGKTTVLGWLSAFLGIHGLMLSDPTQLLGRFNAHLETISYVGLNELGWAGDKDAAAKLKSIITDPTIIIERKHGGVYSIPNVLHVMATSNNDWIVPAGDGARRFFVLDVDQARASDRAYFAALYHEAENGGIEALMYYLQHFRLETVNLRAVPVTDALREQQERSLSLQAQWALDLADRAGNKGVAAAIIFGQTVLTRALYDDYLTFATSRRVRPLDPNVFGKWLTKVGLQDDRTSAQRQRILPPADEFAKLVRRSAGVHE